MKDDFYALGIVLTAILGAWNLANNYRLSRGKIIGRPPSGRKEICCTGIATWFFLSSKVIGAH